MRAEDVDIMFLSELKRRAGFHYDNHNIEGYSVYEDLREEDQGGVAVYVENGLKHSMRKWEGLAGVD